MAYGNVCGVEMDDGSVCDRPVHAKGLCALHLSRKRGGTPMGQALHASARPIGECSIAVCDRPAYAQSLCYAHYERNKRGYEMETPIRPVNEPDEAKVDRILADARWDGECLIAARLGRDGYATSVKDENGVGIKSHRLIYRVKVGPLKSGYQVHHACANRACINPEHLILATQRENVGEMLARLSYERRIEKLEADNAELRRRLGMPTEST